MEGKRNFGIVHPNSYIPTTHDGFKPTEMVKTEPLEMIAVTVPIDNFFCLLCALPMTIRIRLSPCYHVCCDNCFFKVKDSCLICKEDIEDCDVLHPADQLYICKEEKCLRVFLNEASLKYHEVNGCLKNGDYNEAVSINSIDTSEREKGNRFKLIDPTETTNCEYIVWDKNHQSKENSGEKENFVGNFSNEHRVFFDNFPERNFNSLSSQDPRTNFMEPRNYFLPNNMMPLQYGLQYGNAMNPFVDNSNGGGLCYQVNMPGNSSAGNFPGNNFDNFNYYNNDNFNYPFLLNMMGGAGGTGPLPGNNGPVSMFMPTYPDSHPDLFYLQNLPHNSLMHFPVTPQLPIPSHQSPIPAHQTPIPSHQTPIPSHQTPIPSHQTPIPSHQTPIPSHQTPIPFNIRIGEGIPFPGQENQNAVDPILIMQPDNTSQSINNSFLPYFKPLKNYPVNQDFKEATDHTKQSIENAREDIQVSKSLNQKPIVVCDNPEFSVNVSVNNNVESNAPYDNDNDDDDDDLLDLI